MLATSMLVEMEGSSSLVGVEMGFCSVCLDIVRDSNERSIAKLKCGHFFHLDCIGSTFNAKGSMQCPNCRSVETGEWLYANGANYQENTSMTALQENDVELFARSINTSQASVDLVELFPALYQRSTIVPEGSNPPPSTSTEHVARVLRSLRDFLNSFHTYLVAQRLASIGSVGAFYNTSESVSPLQNGHRSENSAGIPLSILNNRTRGSHASRNIQASRDVQNLNIADLALSFERGGWSSLGSRNQVDIDQCVASGNRLDSSQSHSSMQVDLLGDPVCPRHRANRRRNPVRSSGTIYQPIANNQGQRVNQPSNIPSHRAFAQNNNRPRDRERRTGIYPDFNRLANGCSRHGLNIIIGSQSATPADSLTASTPSCMQRQNDAQQYASARERNCGFRQTAYYDQNPCQHANSQSMEGISFGSISPRTLQALQRSSPSRVESHNSFEDHITQHTHANQIPSTQDGSIEHMSPYFANSREPRT